jgi:flagellar basal body-associated protein FliL
MRKIFGSRRRIVVICLAAVVVLGGASAAFAYFSSSGNGTGQAQVGSASTWTVTAGNPTGTIYPGAGSSTIVFTVKNNASGEQQFSNATASVNSNNGNITASGSTTGVSGCLATWFNATVTSDPSINTNIASGGTAQVTVTVTMPSSTTNQNACQSVTPDINLSVQ